MRRAWGPGNRTPNQNARSHCDGGRALPVERSMRGLQLEIAAVVAHHFLTVIVDVRQQLPVQAIPAGTLQNILQLLRTFHGADGQHLRPFTVHGIQNFARLNAELHQFWGEFADDELGELLFAAHFDVPLHQQLYHGSATSPFSGQLIAVAK